MKACAEFYRHQIAEKLLVSLNFHYALLFLQEFKNMDKTWYKMWTPQSGPPFGLHLDSLLDPRVDPHKDPLLDPHIDSPFFLNDV